MDRSFIAITAIASALVFAGVWTAVPPPGAAPPDLGRPIPVPGALQPPEAEQRARVATAAPVRDAAPYNVTRPVYGQFAPSVARFAPAGVVYSGCREARAAGVTPLHRGSPGYREGMDGDGDGIACEDYRR